MLRINGYNGLRKKLIHYNPFLKKEIVKMKITTKSIVLETENKIDKSLTRVTKKCKVEYMNIWKYRDRNTDISKKLHKICFENYITTHLKA